MIKNKGIGKFFEKTVRRDGAYQDPKSRPLFLLMILVRNFLLIKNHIKAWV